MTQKEMIRNHLQANKSITPLEALEMYGCFRLPARIAELKEDGLQIKTDTVKHNGKHFARYRLA